MEHAQSKFQMYVKHFPDKDKPWVGVIVLVDADRKRGEVVSFEQKLTMGELKDWFKLFLSEPTMLC